MVNEFKVGEPVCSDIWPAGKVIRYEPETGYYLVDVDGMEVWSHKKALRKAARKFQVGDQVAHNIKGNGVIIRLSGSWASIELESGGIHHGRLDNLRPRNFLAKIAEEQAINTERLQRNAYGQLVDTVTGLPADSDGIVAIKSIKDTVRSMG